MMRLVLGLHLDQWLNNPPIKRTPLRRACRGSGRYSGRVREYAAVFEIRRDASCAKRVMTDAGRNASGSCAPTDHPMRVLLGQGLLRHRTCVRSCGIANSWDRERCRLGRDIGAGNFLDCGGTAFRGACHLPCKPTQSRRFYMKTPSTFIANPAPTRANEWTMRPISARSRKPVSVLMSMLSSKRRASSHDKTGVLPFFIT
jgi:hypothetical protein